MRAGIRPFDRLAGLAAVLVAAGALLYAAIFVYIVEGSPDQWVVELWYSLLIGGGMLTILALAVVGYIVLTVGGLPRALGSLALFGGFLLVLIYAGRLYDFITPNEKISLIPPVLYGIVVHPVLYGLIGATLWRTAPVVAEPRSMP